MWLTSITCSIAVQEEIAALGARLASLAAEKEAAERRAAEAAGAMAAAQQMWQVAEELRAREAELKAVAQERSALAAQASGWGAGWAWKLRQSCCAACRTCRGAAWTGTSPVNFEETAAACCSSLQVNGLSQALTARETQLAEQTALLKKVG